jgi:hypothetical protein
MAYRECRLRTWPRSNERSKKRVSFSLRIVSYERVGLGSGWRSEPSLKESITRLTTRLDPCCSLTNKQRTRVALMVPLYAARIEDLGPGDFVKVDCAACSHTAVLSTAFLSRLRLSPRNKVLDLKGAGQVLGAAVRGAGGSCRSDGPSRSPQLQVFRPAMITGIWQFRVRDGARHTRLSVARNELLRLATNYDKRADHLDRRTYYW